MRSRIETRETGTNANFLNSRGKLKLSLEDKISSLVFLSFLALLSILECMCASSESRIGNQDDENVATKFV